VERGRLYREKRSGIFGNLEIFYSTFKGEWGGIGGLTTEGCFDREEVMGGRALLAWIFIIKAQKRSQKENTEEKK